MQNGVRATWFGAPDCDTCSSGLCWQTTTTTGASGQSSPRDPAFLLLESKSRFYTRLTDVLLAPSHISWQTEHSIPGCSALSLLSDAWGPLSGKRETTSSSRWAWRLCSLYSLFYSCFMVIFGFRYGTAMASANVSTWPLLTNTAECMTTVRCVFLWNRVIYRFSVCWFAGWCVFSPVRLPVMVRVWA